MWANKTWSVYFSLKEIWSLREWCKLPKFQTWDLSTLAKNNNFPKTVLSLTEISRVLWNISVNKVQGLYVCIIFLCLAFISTKPNHLLHIFLNGKAIAIFLFGGTVLQETGRSVHTFLLLSTLRFRFTPWECFSVA